MTTPNDTRKTSDNDDAVFNSGEWTTAIDNLTTEELAGWEAAHDANPGNGPTIEAYAEENGIELNYEEGAK